MASIKPAQELKHEMDFVEALNILWNEKLLVAIFTLAFTFLSVSYALLQINFYRAEAVLAPVEEEQSSGSLPSQFGLVANLTGLNVSSGSIKVKNAIAILQSREFIRQFVSTHNISAHLMASQWVRNEARLVIDPNLYDTESQLWISDATTPSDWGIYKKFSSSLNVVENENLNLVYISFEWPDPQQAAQWVNWLVSDINRITKQTDLEEANSAISYLRSQIETTQLVDMQRVFYQLIESQTRVVMLADVRDEYVFKVIDPAVAPEDVERPNRLLICFLGAVLGFLISIIIVFTRAGIRSFSLAGDK